MNAGKAGNAAVLCVFVVAVLACTASVFGLWAPRALQSPSLQAEASPVIHTDKHGYLAGETINITGSGFSPYEQIMLRVAHANGAIETGNGHDAWFTYASRSGTFLATSSLSTSDTGGTDFVVQAAGASGAQATVSFSRVAWMSVDGTSHKPGDRVRISAGRFNPNEIVILEVNHRTDVSVLSDETGEISAEVELSPDDPTATSYVVTATGADSSVASALSVSVGWTVVYDQQGGNDQPGQVDLTMFARYDDDPARYRIRFSWDSTDSWTGKGQTGDACALFDANSDGKIDFVVCGQVQNPGADTTKVVQTAGSPFVFTCNNSRTDRCGSPTPVSYTPNDIQAGVVTAGSATTPGASPPGSLITNSDPFVVGDNYPFDTTLELSISKSFLPAGAVLTNVCSYPSAGNGGNNNPFDCVAFAGDQGPGFLVIKKDAGGNNTTDFTFNLSPVPSGQPASYTIKGGGQTNTIGLLQGTAVSVSEALPSGWSLNGASCKLDDGTSTGSLSGNTVSNITIASGKITTCTFVNGSLTTDNKSLKVVKTAAASFSNPPKSGDTITYSFLMTNTGNVTLSGIQMTDALVGYTNVNVAEALPPSASTTTSAAYTITQADIQAGHVLNAATACANSGSVCGSGQVDTAIPQVKSLGLVTAAAETSYVAAGDVLHYSYTLTNNGNVTLSGPFTVTDNKTSATCPSTPSTLTPADSINCTAAYSVNQADVDSGSVTNTATGHGRFNSSAVDSDQASVTVRTGRKPGISLKKTASAASYETVGATLTYSFAVTNTGNAPISSFTITDPHAGMSPINCPVTSLAPGASTTCTATYIIKQPDMDSGQISNTATVNGTAATGPLSATDSVTVKLTQKPAVSLSKTGAYVGGNPVKVGGAIGYTFKITNTGNVTLTTASLTDALIAYNGVACGSTPLAPAASTTCSANYSLTQADINAGFVTNSATVCSTPSACGSSTVTTPLAQNQHLSLTKTGSPTSYYFEGQVITYTLVATNDGSTTLSSVSISDPKLSVLTCTPPQPATLAVGGNLTCTGAYKITAADLAAGAVTNTATASATQLQSASQSFTVVAEQTESVQFMTGGGQIGKNLASHGMNLHCSSGATPNNLQVNSHGKDGVDFHMDNEDSAHYLASCFRDPAVTALGSPHGTGAGQPNKDQFNTICGSGVGTLDGVAGTPVYFKFTDAGEPGKQDTAQILIPGPGSSVTIQKTGTAENGTCSLVPTGKAWILNVSGTIRGNHQAH